MWEFIKIQLFDTLMVFLIYFFLKKKFISSFANNLDQDQARHYVSAWSASKALEWYSWGNLCIDWFSFFQNSLDPDQAWHAVGSDVDPNCLTLWWYSKIYIKHVDLFSFSNILDQDQPQHNFGPDLDPYCSSKAADSKMQKKDSW